MVAGFPDIKNSPETFAQLRSLYLALATEVDHHIGRVVSWLKSSGQWDNTILIVTSDHGEMLGDFGLWGKGTFHDAAFHVPLIVRDPARPDMHGEVHSGFTESIDIPATILARVGAEVPSSMNGRSLLGILRTKTHRLVEFGAGLPQVLFDMDGNGETESIATRPENMPTLLDLTRKMLNHRMINADPTFARTLVRAGGVKIGLH